MGDKVEDIVWQFLFDKFKGKFTGKLDLKNEHSLISQFRVWEVNELKNRCAKCHVLLTDENRVQSTPYHFNRVCKQHEEYATIFLID
jgi:hypothetical protein